MASRGRRRRLMRQIGPREEGRLQAPQPRRPGAPVSMPLTWSQVKKGLDPTKYTVRTVPALVEKMTAWEDYCDGERPLAGAIKRLGKV
jgi:DNA primase